MTANLITIEPKDDGRTSSIPRDEQPLTIGRWFWVDESKLSADSEVADSASEEEEEEEEDSDLGPEPDDDLEIEGAAHIEEDEEDETRWLGCVTHIGSNFATLTAAKPSRYGGSPSLRVHFDVFEHACTPELNADAIIAAGVEKHQTEARRLMGEVHRITASLSVRVSGALSAPAESETQALALRGSGIDIAEYKQSLVRAKTKDLPELFSRIETENKMTAGWMQAQLIPMKAKAAGLTPAIKAIERRIFNVELYAGLSEEVVRIKDGPPADLSEKVTLMQRRAYMDEECLVAYEAGGMEFKDIRAFDRWLARRANRDRLLPSPRCIIAFRVRRNEKERETPDLSSFIRMFYEREADMMTYLYIRNGEQLFRISTAIDFGAQLFPDLGTLDTSQMLYVNTRLISRDSGYLITEGQYLALLAEEEAHAASIEKGARKIKNPFPGDDPYGTECLCTTGGRSWCSFNSFRKKTKDYEPYTHDSVYYDDATQHIADEMARHNRLVTVLQGLLDRSEVLHPHPPWQLWTPEGFNAALNLIYDSARAIVSGDAPDFETYRAKLNASIKVGSVTVGQEDEWMRIEADKYNSKYRKNDFTRKRYRPDGNPGPGLLAHVVEMKPRAKTCVYRWTRKKTTGRKVWVPSPEKPGWGWNRTTYDDTPQNIAAPMSALLNVSAYTAGDFRQFYDDPRTRAEYLQWAPLLLVAEDFACGKRQVGTKGDDE